MAFERSTLPLLLALVAACTNSAGADDHPAPRADPAFAELPTRGEVDFEPAELESRVPEPFRLARHEFSFTVRPGRTLPGVRISKVTFPSPVETEAVENNTVHAEYFQPDGAGPYPACVVLHILGGDFLLSQTVACHLARQNIAALFVKMPYYGERRPAGSARRMISVKPEESVAGMTQAVLDIRRGAAWLSQRGEVDSQRLGITGISLGGIMSALAAQAEPRLRNVAIVLGGGNLAEILWQNDTREAHEFRRNWLANGGTKESFMEILRPVDPATCGHLLADRRVLMIAAKNDEIVVPESTLALWESIGSKPSLVWLDAGHYTAIRYLPRELVRLDLFFNGRD